MLSNDQNSDSGIETQESEIQLNHGNCGTEKSQTLFHNQFENLEPQQSCEVIDTDSSNVRNQVGQQVNEEVNDKTERIEAVDDVNQELEEGNLSASKEMNSKSEANGSVDDYEFSIDDLEESESFEPKKVAIEMTEIISESSNKDNDEISTNKNIDELKETNENAYKYDDLDKEIEGFENEKEEVKKDLPLSILLRQKLVNIKPRLSGTPDDVIDLESGVTKPREIVTLMKRFEKHTAKNAFHKHKVKLK